MSRPQRQGLLVLGILSGQVSVLANFDSAETILMDHEEVIARATEHAEAATQQGRASQTFLIPYLNRFSESERHIGLFSNTLPPETPAEPQGEPEPEPEASETQTTSDETLTQTTETTEIGADANTDTSETEAGEVAETSTEGAAAERANAKAKPIKL